MIVSNRSWPRRASSGARWPPSSAARTPTTPTPATGATTPNELEGLDDLARMDRRIDELERLLADPAALETPAGLADGTTVTLRFPDGDEATYRIVAIPDRLRPATATTC